MRFGRAVEVSAPADRGQDGRAAIGSGQHQAVAADDPAVAGIGEGDVLQQGVGRDAIGWSVVRQWQRHRGPAAATVAAGQQLRSAEQPQAVADGDQALSRQGVAVRQFRAGGPGAARVATAMPRMPVGEKKGV